MSSEGEWNHLFKSGRALSLSHLPKGKQTYSPLVPLTTHIDPKALRKTALHCFQSILYGIIVFGHWRLFCSSVIFLHSHAQSRIFLLSPDALSDTTKLFRYIQKWLILSRSVSCILASRKASMVYLYFTHFVNGPLM